MAEDADKDAARRERLAAQLRENLRRRKAQARQLAERQREPGQETDDDDRPSTA